MSVKCSIGWLGTTVSLFCSEFASRMQQKAPNATAHDYTDEVSGLRQLKRLQTISHYPTVGDSDVQKLSAVVFSDAAKHHDRGQLAYVAGLLLDDPASGWIFHVVAWSSHCAKRPVRSIGAAEILAAGESIDEGKMLAATLGAVFNSSIPFEIILDSSDLFTSLSTQRQSIDKSTRADVNVIRHDLERRNVSKFTWISGKANLADVGTKSDSPVADAFRLTLADGRLAVDL